MAKPKYEEYQQDIVLLKGIADIHPYPVHLPDAPAMEKFVNHGLVAANQYFKREVIPHELKKIDAQVKSGVISRDEGVQAIENNPELVDFVEMLWRKRTGEQLEFQLINGIPTYISPTYWFYLNFWHMDTGLPDFRTDKYHLSGDLEEFYCWDLLVVPSDFCYGLTELSSRRGGKTYKGGCILYEPISRNYENHGYLQSKTDLDAERAFTKAIVKPWRKLPFFFQPIYSNSSFPKKEGLQFAPRSRSGKSGEAQLYDNDALMSEIVYVSSEAMAVDGQKAHRMLEDETGKTVNVDTYERWNVNKFTLTEKGRIVGKAFHPTTVEEMEKKGGKFYKAKWNDSDRSPLKRGVAAVKVDENGETVSGLWQWFIPSYCNEIFNQYGSAIVDTITEKEKAFLKAQKYPYWDKCGMESVNFQIDKQPNQHKRQEIIRKKPRNIKEAFKSSNSFSHFNTDILDERLAHFRTGYTLYELPASDSSATDVHNAVNEADLSGPGLRWGKFDWMGEPFKSDVKFTPTDFDNARCHVNYLMPVAMRNLKIPMPNGKFKPANTASLRSGADPFKYDTPDIKNPSKMSMGTQHIYMFYDDLIDHFKPRKNWISNNFIYEYEYRPQSKDELFEDYAKACIYYGCSCYPERNNSDVLDYFKRMGLEHYIQYGMRIKAVQGQGIGYTLDTVGGDITGDLVIQKMFRHVENWVNNDAAQCVFYRTLEQIRDVEKDNLNPYDLFVSAAYTLMAAYEADIANSQLPEKSEFGADDLEFLNGYKAELGQIPQYMNERY